MEAAMVRRVWVLDHGMVSEDNAEILEQDRRRERDRRDRHKVANLDSATAYPSGNTVFCETIQTTNGSNYRQMPEFVMMDLQWPHLDFVH
jgi:hypothetical protein